MFLRLSNTQNKIATKIIALTLIVFMAAAVITTTVQAGITCLGWENSGQCCDSWYPGEQIFMKRSCVNCSSTGCVPFTDWDCKDISTC
jgi:hypothetical protein